MSDIDPKEVIPVYEKNFLMGFKLSGFDGNIRYFYPGRPFTGAGPRGLYKFSFWFMGFGMYSDFLDTAHRFCTNWFGPSGDEWRHHTLSTSFSFKNEEDAMTFKKFWPMIREEAKNVRCKA